ncbi:metallophosphoesterase [Ensifer sp. ENS04]|uniref:metallophosphoesterase n=1 Tax=Ensifer sp. ENS04 TaxID=2769281 RepID=UPI001782DD7B|nr:metallophosphoesterase [Ensifer sp. ENS04]MBD9538951.1 metallophosphoesterase [Ensifer sp. ENS04]
MKAWVFSDLHLEFGKPFSGAVPSDADVVVCAGDLLTHGIVPSVEWLAVNIAPDLPVVFVAGNHEYYRAAVQESIKAARALRDRCANVHFLENDAVDIGGVRFVGGTLWTDFRILGKDPALAMATAETGMNDFRKIKYAKQPFRKFKPIHAFRMHQETRAFLTSALRNAGGGKTVVVSHHAPSRRSIPDEFADDPLSACYASDLESLIIETAPSLWVHGHVHSGADYEIGQTRIVSNPRGYPGERSDFDPHMVIDI